MDIPKENIETDQYLDDGEKENVTVEENNIDEEYDVDDDEESKELKKKEEEGLNTSDTEENEKGGEDKHFKRQNGESLDRSSYNKLEESSIKYPVLGQNEYSEDYHNQHMYNTEFEPMNQEDLSVVYPSFETSTNEYKQDFITSTLPGITEKHGIKGEMLEDIKKQRELSSKSSRSREKSSPSTKLYPLKSQIGQESNQMRRRIKRSLVTGEKNREEGSSVQQIGNDEHITDSLKSEVLPERLIHTIQPRDTLSSISIQYDVDVEKIMNENKMLNEDLDYFDKKQIIIPKPNALPKAESKEETEEERIRNKEHTIFFFMRTERGIKEEEARYYLSVNDYNIKKAMKNYYDDLIWEKEEKIRKRELQNKERTANLLENRLIRKIVGVFGFCIPSSYSYDYVDDSYHL